MFNPYQPHQRRGVEQAKGDLAKLMELKKFTASSLTIQQKFRQFESHQIVSSIIKQTLSAKITDLKKLKLILGAKLSVLPVGTLKELIRQCFQIRSFELLLQIQPWIISSINCQIPEQNLMTDQSNWNLIVKLAVSFSAALVSHPSNAQVILSILFPASNSVSEFYRFLLLYEISVQQNLLANIKRLIQRQLLVFRGLNGHLKNLLDLAFAPCSLYKKLDMNFLSNSDKTMAYDYYVNMQAYIVQNIVSLPRITKVLLTCTDFQYINWKELIQSYYYTSLAEGAMKSSDASTFLFANLWELLQAKFVHCMTPNELVPLLMTCAKAVQNLSVRLLHTDPSASILEPENVKNLRNQLKIFTDTLKVTSIFKKIIFYQDGFSSEFNLLAAQSLCQIYNSFYEKSVGVKEAQYVVAGIIGGLAFNKTIIYSLWKLLENFCDLNLFLNFSEGFLEYESSSHVLGIFVNAYQNYLLVVDQEDFPGVFSVQELQIFTDFLIKFVHLGILEDFDSKQSTLLFSCSKLLKLIHQFNSKLRIFSENLFHLSKRQIQALMIDLSQLQHSRLEKALRIFPFCVPFQQRVQVLHQQIKICKQSLFYGMGAQFIIRRENLMNDSINQLLKLPDIRGKLKIQFVNQFGMIEQGIDAGGLFKQFWTSLSSQAFNPQYGLFSVTEDQCLYPNPQSALFFGQDYMHMFYLVGRILGKAIFQQITVAPKFAQFFLRKMIGKQNFLEDLKSLDSSVYNNLKFLKNYTGDASELCLSFITNRSDGSEIQLIKNGRNIQVNNQNKLKYIYNFAHYRLNQQIHPQCQAFFKGFNQVIKLKWIQCFNSNEMQIIISGTMERIDVKDLQRYTQYVGCHQGESFVKYFWKAVESFTAEEQSLLLQFVTSCPRPPLFGFVNLHPPFTISKVQISHDDEKLPTAQTCVNTLKVPMYKSAKVMKKKILLAVTSGAGFDFSQIIELVRVGLRVFIL